MAFATKSPNHTPHSKLRQNSVHRRRKSTKSRLAHRTPMRNRPLKTTMRIPASAPYALRVSDIRATIQFENAQTHREAEQRERQRMRDQFVREENARKERMRLAELAFKTQMEAFQAQREGQQRAQDVYDSREIAREQKEREERQCCEEKEARYGAEDRYVNYSGSGYDDHAYDGYDGGFLASRENHDGHGEWESTGQGASANEDTWEDDADGLGYENNRHTEDENQRRDLMDVDDENDDDRYAP